MLIWVIDLFVLFIVGNKWEFQMKINYFKFIFKILLTFLIKNVILYTLINLGFAV